LWIVITVFFYRAMHFISTTHRRSRRDSTVDWVGVASASAVCIEFTTSSRRLPTKIWKLNVLRIYPVELSRVELCRRCVRARRLSWPSLQFCSLYMTSAENWKLGHDDWYFHTADTTPLDFVVGKLFRLVETRRDCRQLVANSIHTADATQLDTRQLSCVGVGGVYWALVSHVVCPSVCDVGGLWSHSL